jgi:3-isopropylmalate dehydrogenase
VIDSNDERITATIALLPGDGIGPEVVRSAKQVLESVGTRFGHSLRFETSQIGGAAIDVAGVPLPDATLATCRAADAVLLGAVGGPRWDSPTASVRPEQGLLGLRRELGLFANIRPVRPYASLASASPLRPDLLRDVDLVVVRELTGGIYFGAKTLDRIDDGERATDLCVYTTAEIERITRVAAELARSRRGLLTSVDKANVLETSRLWRRVVTCVMRDEFPDVRVEHALVDSCAMQLVRQPAAFDVIVTENMFGDILTDEAAVLAGSIGVLPSASLGSAASASGTRPGLYEPIHGSAPDIAGTGRANPVGTILSAAMLVRHSFGLVREARLIEAAVQATIDDGILTADLTPPTARAYSTTEVTDRVIEHLLSS